MRQRADWGKEIAAILWANVMLGLRAVVVAASWQNTFFVYKI
jgi:hypothetical protein